MLTRGAEYSLSRIRVSLSHSSPSLVTARRSDFRRGGCDWFASLLRCYRFMKAAMAAALVAREEVDGTVVRTTNSVQAGVVDLVRRPWWWSFSSPLVLLNSWWSWLVDARVRCYHGEDGEAWWLRRVGAAMREGRRCAVVVNPKVASRLVQW